MEEYRAAFQEFQNNFTKMSIDDNFEEFFYRFFEKWPQYLDPIILLIRFYRINKIHEKASLWIYRFQDELELNKRYIFEKLLCENEFIFEKIFDEYIFKKNIELGIRYAIQYLNMKGSCNIPFIYTNLHFFSHKIPGNVEWLNFNNDINRNGTSNTFYNSSATYYAPDNILCIRHVNYLYDDLIGKPQAEKYISKNLIYWIGSKYNLFAQEYFLDLQTKATRCFGLEDIRLISNNGICEFWATQQQWSGDGINRIMRGNLIFDDSLGPIFTNPQIIQSPNEDITCEKNWIPFYENNGRGNLHVIYNWWPFQVGTILPETNKLKIIYEQDGLPEIFKYMRGSSCLVRYNRPDTYCCVTHISLEPQKELRIYFHFLIFLILKDKKLEITQFTDPFYFPEKDINIPHKIQYCIGFNICPQGLDTRAQFWFSSMDRQTGFIECPMIFFEKHLHSVIKPTI